MFRQHPGGQQQQQQHQSQPPPPNIPTHSWYPPSVSGSSSSGPSRVPPPIFSSSSSGTSSPSRTPTSTGFQPQTSLQGSSTIVASLKDKSVEELGKLMHDTETYKKFLESLDEVRRLDKLRNQLSNGNVDESRKNLEKESEIAELRNQCMIIRNTELAAAQERFEEVEKQYKEVHARCSPQSLLDKLQSAANDADDESENLHRKLLSGEIELGEFIQIYRKQRILFHRRTLIRMAALTSLTTPG
ncbi:unnamed protein product [Sphagnum troendelagicum]|uniref:VPS37 C-terminal domain-containing protein n=1 Tax=Sphagnum troendelagicum TaxID=128251 RepID=A0ABP0UDP0_9BRYO